MAEETDWVTFASGSDSEESLSFSNLPVTDIAVKESLPENPLSSDEHFEFHPPGAAGDFPSCAAEDIFFHGQLLPHGAITNPVSRSDSSASISLDNSSSSSSSSTSVISRSVSSSSSDGRQRRRRSSSALYAYPSPSPRVTPVRRNGSGAGSGRRSTGSAPPAGWGLLRLGVVMAPEMELRDIRLRRTGRAGQKLMRDGEKSTVWKLLGLTGCRCSPEDAVAGKMVGKKKKMMMKKGEGIAGTKEKKERMFEWLEELSLGKEPLIG